MNSYKIIGKSILAGAFIGIASLLYNNLVVLTGYSIIPALVFSIGLLCVLYFKSYLFTGKVGYLEKPKDIWYLFIIFIFNLIACLPLYFISIPNMATPAFLSQSFISLFIKGVICGIFIYMAVFLFNKPDMTKYKIYTTIAAVAGFILCGSRHCIADFAALCLFTPFATFCGWIPLLKILVIAFGNAIGSIVIHQMNKRKYLT